jgi:AcrR family transcriptional regulator
MPDKKAYHHGDLREALIAAAVDIIADEGVDKISLRQLARQSGVSHGAPAHHFKDRTGLFTAIATRGFERLHQELTARVEAAANTPKARLNASGIAYVLFAVHSPGYFKVMFRAELLDRGDPGFDAASKRSYRVLREAIADVRAGQSMTARQIDLEVVRAWSQAHGLATLWLNGALGEAQGGDDIEALVEVVFATDG